MSTAKSVKQEGGIQSGQDMKWAMWAHWAVSTSFTLSLDEIQHVLAIQNNSGVSWMRKMNFAWCSVLQNRNFSCVLNEIGHHIRIKNELLYDFTEKETPQIEPKTIACHISVAVYISE